MKTGDNKTADIASETVIKEDMKIDCIAGTDDYYFKIDKEVYEKYLEYLNKAYYEGYYHYDDPDLDKDEFVYDKENADITEEDLEAWFKTEDNKKYLVKMIRAQIASSYPKLSDYKGGINESIDPINPVDENGDYVAQGVAEIYRTKVNNDGSTGEEIRLTYLPYDKFHELVVKGDSAALNYFSFNEDSGVLYYAIYKQETGTINGVDQPDMGSYTLMEEAKSYKTITSLCDMPFNFLFSLLQESENPNYIMAVIDLLMEETRLKLMIQDELSTTTLTLVDTEYHAEKTITTNYVSNKRDGNTVWTPTGSRASYSYPAGEPVITRIETKTYENTANIFIKEAYTWCIDYEQKAVQPVKYNREDGEELSENYTYSQAELAALSYPAGIQEGGPQSQNQTSYSTKATSLSYETLPYRKTNKQDYEIYTYDIVPVKEKRINYERFLGLWKNDTGEYYLGCEYDPNGKEVKFDLPEDYDEAEYNFPAVEIPEYNEMRIDSLVDLLSNHDDTEMQEELMKYYWNIYTSEDIYEVNIDEILDLFDTSIFNASTGGVSGGATGGVIGNSIEDKVWYSLKNMGLSDYAVAGAMGNIKYESGFKTSTVEGGTKEGIGLCQWSYGRKTKLIAYAESKGTTWEDENIQVQFLMGELTPGGGAEGYATYQFMSKRYADGWKNAKDTDSATENFCMGFERPGNPPGSLPTRKQYAQEYYDKYHGKEAYVGAKGSVTVGGHTYPHYLQKNFSYRYGTSTIAVAGCGPTSLAMILAGLLDNPAITPETVVKNLEEYFPNYRSYYVPGAGSNMRTGVLNNGYLSKYYGVKMTYVSTGEGIEQVAAGKSALGSVEGHILAIVPVPEEYQGQGYKFYIIDSARGLTGPYRNAEEVKAKPNSGGVFRLTYIIEKS